MIECISAYRSSLGEWSPGEVVDDPELAAALLVDSPGSWTPVADDSSSNRALDAAPKDRMQRPASKRTQKRA